MIHTNFIRLFWTLTILCCSCTTVYQIVNRFKYYYTYPIRVSTEVTTIKEMKPLRYEVCVYSNEYFDKNINVTPGIIPCVQKLIKLVAQDDVSFEDLFGISKDRSFFEEFNIISRKKVKRNSTVKVENENSPFGLCAVVNFERPIFHNESETVFQMVFKEGNKCDPNFYWVNMFDVHKFAVGIALFSGYEFNLLHHFQYFYFQNTSQKRCFSQETVNSCYQNCFLKSLTDNVYCKTNFHSSDVLLPPCTDFQNTSRSVTHTLKLTMGDVANCKCGIICKQRKMTMDIEGFRIKEPKLKMNIKYDLSVTIFTENLSYLKSDLAVDLGGIIGIFFGISLMSIAKVLHSSGVFVNKIVNSKKKKQLRLIMSLFSIKYNHNFKQQIFQSKKPRSKNKFQFLFFLVVMATSLVACVVIYDRAKLFLQYPVETLIRIQESYVYFPSITLCGTCTSLGMKFTQYAEANNISDACQVDLLDLLYIKNHFTPNKLWKMALCDSLVQKFYDFLNDKEVKLLTFNFSIIPTHLGNCEHITMAKESFRGSFSSASISYLTSFLFKCNHPTLKIFFGDMDSESYNILMSTDIPMDTQSITSFYLTSVNRINTKTHPCIDVKKYNLCIEKCIEYSVRIGKFCSLPNFSHLTNKSMCTTPGTAKESQKKYIHIMLKSKYDKYCNCTRSCNQSIFTYHSLTFNELPLDLSGILINTRTNLREFIEESEKYTLMMLFCDICNILALALGLCVMDVTRFVLIAPLQFKTSKVLKNLEKKFTNKPKKDFKKKFEIYVHYGRKYY